MCIKITTTIKGNYLIIAKTSGTFTFESFQSIKLILDKNKKLYNYIWFKKIPHKINTLFIKNLDIIIELLSSMNITGINKLIKTVASKLTFKLQLIYLKI